MVGSSVGVSDTEAVGCNVGALVGLLVGFSVGELVSAEVGGNVGDSVGLLVGFSVGNGVGQYPGICDGDPVAVVGEGVDGLKVDGLSVSRVVGTGVIVGMLVGANVG